MLANEIQQLRRIERGPSLRVNFAHSQRNDSNDVIGPHFLWSGPLSDEIVDPRRKLWAADLRSSLVSYF